MISPRLVLMDLARKVRDKKIPAASARRMARLLAVPAFSGQRPTDAFETFAMDQGDDVEQMAVSAAAAAPYRRRLATYEKAVSSVVLWFLLRSNKRDRNGRRIVGTHDADSLVFMHGGEFEAPIRLAEALPRLEALAAEYEGQGIRLDPIGSAGVRNRAEAGIRTLMDGLPDDVTAALDPQRYLLPALDEARSTMLQIMRAFDSQFADEFTPLDVAEADEIASLNARGLVWNIENIAVRNGRSAIEKIINALGNKRLLGLVSESRAISFNRLYTDLSLEAHFRATFRGAMLALALKNGYPFLLMVSPRNAGTDPGSDLSGAIYSIDEWEALGEQRGAPNAIRQFGFHPGSKSFWFPVPTSARKRLTLRD